MTTRYPALIALVFMFQWQGYSVTVQNRDGYSIEVRLNDFKNDTVILGQRFNESYIRKDTACLDGSGKGVFSGESALEQGMYLIYLPNNRFFDLIIGEDQQFSLENDTTDLIGNMKISGSVENSAFYDYQQFLQKRRLEAAEMQERIKNTDNKLDSLRLAKELAALNQEVRENIRQRVSDNEGTFFGVFLKALQEVEVPDPPRDEHGNITDPHFQYRYFKQHYFDNFDVSDVRLLRTPLYENKIMRYIERVAVQVPDSLIREVDMLIARSRSDPQLFRYMLITLFNHFASSQIMGMDAVYVHIAEKYYIPEAEWSSEDFISKLKERIEKLKPILIGAKATDIQLVRVSSDHMIAAMDDQELKENPYIGDFFNLHDIEAKYTILYFWEVDCGHCKIQTPALYEVYQRLRDKGVEVVAVHILGGEEGKAKWIDHVNEKGFYDWINCWNPYDFTYKKIYDVQSTPTLFVLDEDKKIVAKKIAPEQAERIINAMLGNGQSG